MCWQLSVFVFLISYRLHGYKQEKTFGMMQFFDR